MDITATPVWQALQHHRQQLDTQHMRQQFAEQPQRFAQLSGQLDGMLVDYSKNRLDEHALTLLCRLAETAGLAERIEAMRSGVKINTSEARAVLHTALRLPQDAEAVYVDGGNILPQVHQGLEQALAFAGRLLDGSHCGATGKPITDFVNIGIGGSDLGPQMAAQALHAFGQGIKVHFVANADDADIAQTLSRLNAETTVFCVASKSFGTPETLLNAQAARAWFLQQGRSEADIGRHFAAVSSNPAAAAAFGIPAEQVFAMSDWVGGRYSVWSAIGLPLMVAVGTQHFRSFLAGGHRMDQHFFDTPYRNNLPVLLALIGVWYNNFWQAAGHTVVPYSHNLRRFPAYLQQLDMESNGKGCGLNGEALRLDTGPIVFGEEGVNCQHAYFQLLHQGTRLIPVDFIVPMNSPYGIERQHRFTVANAFAQAEALMRGKTREEACAELSALPEAERATLAAQKTFPGNRPSNSILLDVLDPYRLGMLMAMYEHKVFVQGVIWGINPFDQWGVEYGKVLAKTIEPELAAAAPPTAHDSSTLGLMDYYRKCRPQAQD